MAIGREDCRNVEAIAASSWGLGIKEVCAFDWVFFFLLLVLFFRIYFVCLSSWCILRLLLLCEGGTNVWIPLQFLCSRFSSIDLFSLHVLLSYFRPCDATRGNSLFQMLSYARANVRTTNEKKHEENYHEGITLSEMGKQNVQAKAVYSEMDQSDTPKTPKFISKRLFTS